MLDRFRVAMTLVGAMQVAIVGMMAYATQISYSIPAVIAIGMTGLSLFLAFVSVQMPSWQSSPGVSKEATATENKN